MRTKIIPRAIIVFFLTIAVVTQLSGQQLWVKYISGYSNPLNKMVVDQAGSVYVAGHDFNGGFLTKYFTTGQTEWQVTSLSYLTAMVIDNSSNIYLAGVGGSPNLDYQVYKYDSSGVLLWHKTYDGIYHNDDGATAICTDNAGNVFVTGNSDDSMPIFRTYCTLKYNSNGVLQWANRYVNSPYNFNFNQATAIATDNSGNVYVTGNSENSTASNSGYATIKYSSAGNQLWEIRYDGPNNNSISSPCAIAVDPSGNIIVTGNSDSAGMYNYATLKYNSSGIQQWVQLYSGVGNYDAEATALATDAIGNIYVTGFSYSPVSNYDFVTLKYNSAGSQQWAIPYNGPSNKDDKATAIALDGTGNVYVAGSSFDSLTNNNFSTIKYDNNGVLLWNETFNTLYNGSDIPCAVAVDTQGNTYVSGTVDNSYATIKYGIATGLEVLQYGIMGISIYPNPSYGLFTIQTNSQQPLANSQLEIYNSLGEKIRSQKLISEKTEIDLSDEASGIYFVRVRTGREVFTEKIVIEK